MAWWRCYHAIKKAAGLLSGGFDFSNAYIFFIGLLSQPEELDGHRRIDDVGGQVQVAAAIEAVGQYRCPVWRGQTGGTEQDELSAMQAARRADVQGRSMHAGAGDLWRRCQVADLQQVQHDAGCHCETLQAVVRHKCAGDVLPGRTVTDGDRS